MTPKLRGLYGITSQDMLLHNDLLLSKTEQALQGGMRLLQYRNKHKQRPQTLTQLKQLKQLCHDYKALFIINDDVELCRTIAADGVHLGKDDSGIQNAKQLLGTQAVIGISCYNDFSLAQAAQQNGASYVAFGAFYPSPTKPEATTAKAELLQQAQSLSIPCCSIGGINTDNALTLVQQGSDMIAVISDLFDVADTKSNAEKFSNMF